MRALIVCLAVAGLASACKRQPASTALLNADATGPCGIGGDDDKRQLTPADFVNCSDADLNEGHAKLDPKIAALATAVDDKERALDLAAGQKPLTDAELPAIGDKKRDTLAAQAPTTAASTDQAGAGLKLYDSGADLAQLRRDSEALRAQAQALIDRQTAIDREIAARTGQGMTGGACVLTRDAQITSCRPNSADTDCKAMSQFNRAFYFRFGQCAEFQTGADFDDTFRRISGACVKVTADLRIETCRDALLDDCFDKPADLLAFAFRSAKSCISYRSGDRFENLTPDSQRPFANSTFDADCRASGSALKASRLGLNSTYVCPCGTNNELSETVFYQRGGVAACSVLAARVSNVTPGTGGKFEADCRGAGGVFRRSDAGAFVCACGINNELNEDPFYRNGFDSCRAAAGNLTGGSVTRFESDCKFAGAVFKQSSTNANISVCACGKKNELDSATFYKYGAESCRLKQQQDPASNVTPALKEQFRQRCIDGQGRPADDNFADDGMSCACGTVAKFSLRSFARDVQLGTSQAFVDACRREVSATGNPVQDQRSQVVRAPNNRLNNATGTSRCLCGPDTFGRYCGVSSNGAWIDNMGPYAANSFVCGTHAPGDLCLTGKLKTALDSATCR